MRLHPNAFYGNLNFSKNYDDWSKGSKCLENYHELNCLQISAKKERKLKTDTNDWQKSLRDENQSPCSHLITNKGQEMNNTTMHNALKIVNNRVTRMLEMREVNNEIFYRDVRTLTELIAAKLENTSVSGGNQQ